MKWLQNINSSALLAALLILIASQAFFYAPFRPFFALREVYGMVCLMAAVAGVLYWRKKRIPYYVPLTIMMSLLIVWPAVTAMFSFGQPIIYGMASGRLYLGLQSFIVLYFLLDRGKIDLDSVKRGMMLLIWASLLSYLAVNLILSPKELYERFHEYRMVVKIDPLRSRYAFPDFFLIIGTLYYFVKYLKEERFTALTCCFAFYTYIVVFDQTRQIILGLGIIMVALLWKGRVKLKRAIPVICLLAAEALISLEKFLALLSTNEPSRIARESELGTVLNFHAEPISAQGHIYDILFGIGRVSNKWHGGYTGVLDKYFYPIDVGVFGVLFVYGVLGLAVFLLFYYLIFREARRLAFKDTDCMLLALKYYVFYSIVIAVFRFQMPYYPGIFASILAIIAFYNRNARNQGSSYSIPAKA